MLRCPSSAAVQLWPSLDFLRKGPAPQSSWGRGPRRGPLVKIDIGCWKENRDAKLGDLGKGRKEDRQTQTRDGGGGQGPHLHEQDFGRTIRGKGRKRKKENTKPKGGMGGRHAATTTQGF